MQQISNSSFHTTRLWIDYITLCKPKVVILLLVTAMVGMQLASPTPTASIQMFIATIGIGLGASAAAVINHLVDIAVDGKMKRTQSRPLATGRISKRNAMLFSLFLGLSSMLLLTVYINLLTAVLTFSGLIGYAVIYTIYLKHSTPQNIVFGGLAGALPPLLGWTSITNSIDIEAMLLVLIIFIWTPAHFWPLAIDRVNDYKNANVPMLPVTHGINYTKSWIIFYSIILVFVSLLPYFHNMNGLLYLISAILLGGYFLFFTFKLKYKPSENSAMETFYASITYLFLLFMALLIDHALTSN
jgi:protoheme IX farnesyltransferase